MTLNTQWWELGTFLFYTVRHQWNGLRLNHDWSRKRIQNLNLWWSRRKVQGREWCSRVRCPVFLGCLIFSTLIHHSFYLCIHLPKLFVLTEFYAIESGH
jgi:hypothetical protein